MRTPWITGIAGKIYRGTRQWKVVDWGVYVGRLENDGEKPKKSDRGCARLLACEVIGVQHPRLANSHLFSQSSFPPISESVAFDAPQYHRRNHLLKRSFALLSLWLLSAR